MPRQVLGPLNIRTREWLEIWYFNLILLILQKASGMFESVEDASPWETSARHGQIYIALAKHVCVINIFERAVTTVFKNSRGTGPEYIKNGLILIEDVTEKGTLRTFISTFSGCFQPEKIFCSRESWMISRNFTSDFIPRSLKCKISSVMLTCGHRRQFWRVLTTLFTRGKAYAEVSSTQVVKKKFDDEQPGTVQVEAQKALEAAEDSFTLLLRKIPMRPSCCSGLHSLHFVINIFRNFELAFSGEQNIISNDISLYVPPHFVRILFDYLSLVV